MSEDVHTLVGAYALDALPDDERRAFEGHLSQCDACRKELTELQQTASIIGASVATRAPAGLKSRVLGEIDRTRQNAPVVQIGPRRSERSPPLQRVAVGAAAGLLLVVAGLSALVYRMDSRLDEAQARMDQLVQTIARPEAQTVPLGGETGTASVVLTGDGGVFVGQGLPPIDEDQVYELWFIGADGAQPAGLFTPAPDGTVVGQVDPLPEGTTTLGVTIEPEGGSPAPTMEPFLTGELTT